MTNYLYSPAPDAAWMAVAKEQQLLVVNSHDPELLGALWANTTDGIHAAIEILTGRGLAATPAFALLEWSATGAHFAARVIVRGNVDVSVLTTGDDVRMSGSHVSTWSEHSIDAATACDISILGSSAAAYLPLQSGVVPVERIQCAFVAGVAPVQARTQVETPASEPVAVSAPLQTPVAPVVPVVPPADAAEKTPLSEATIVDVPTASSTIAAGPPPASAAPSSAAVPSASAPIDDADNSLGETVYRTAPETADVGDHDGMTIMTGDLRKLRAGRASQQANAASAPPAAEHAAALFLELSTGSREQLSQPILVGRAPTVSKVSSGALPRLVTIPGDKDISRNHVHIAVEGGTVVVTDLHSRNGTQVVLPGKSPQRLREGEPTAVIVGTVIDLGGDVTLTVREGN